MARRSRVSVEAEDTELNMTPMLDVVFILLIFFIVTSVFIKTPGIEPVKPYAITADKLDPGIIVAISRDNEIWIDKMPYDISEIRPVILALRDENPKAGGIIQGDRESQAGIVMQVQILMTDLGIDTRVATQ
ncbi:MAG: biopolymer transporter ExbD [Robiginitomaculum sp.]|nr:MAG: biopolymer transporter ExbD [Robiginitomaculum sp.]PHQ66639.1 MAG: biopolymer transporter ExbD [Robiginitomaculum sp.]